MSVRGWNLLNRSNYERMMRNWDLLTKVLWLYHSSLIRISNAGRHWHLVKLKMDKYSGSNSSRQVTVNRNSDQKMNLTSLAGAMGSGRPSQANNYPERPPTKSRPWPASNLLIRAPHTISRSSQANNYPQKPPRESRPMQASNSLQRSPGILILSQANNYPQRSPGIAKLSQANNYPQRPPRKSRPTQANSSFQRSPSVMDRYLAECMARNFDFDWIFNLNTVDWTKLK